MRSSMLDVLDLQHITTARQGFAERKVINKYAVRLAINPLISIMALEIPRLSTSRHWWYRHDAPHPGPNLPARSADPKTPTSQGDPACDGGDASAFKLVADIVLALVDPRIVYN